MKNPVLHFLFMVGMLIPFSATADEPLRIVIEDGIENALPIAIVPFGWSQASSIAPLDMAAIVSQDLSRSGRFDVMPEQDLPQRPTRRAGINYGDWRKLGMENLLIGSMALTESGSYNIRFRLMDVYRQKQIAGFSVTAPPDRLRRIAHQISDIVFEKLIGIRGAFDTRVAYVTVKKENDGKKFSLRLADADGANVEIMLESSEPLLSPSWSPDGRRIAYVSFEGKNSAIYVQDVVSGRRQKVAGYPGINSAPAFSPDGRQLAMTLSKDGNTEIYIMNLASKQLRRMTRHSAIDTEPTWSPDGRKLAFTSDRSGGPQIYEIDINGGAPRRLSFQGSYNTRADYSPDGRYISLVHGEDGAYRVGLLDTQNGYIELLTTARLDESPSFAPNGGMIIYATQGISGGRLAAVSTDGSIQQKLGDETVEVREPAWGPFQK